MSSFLHHFARAILFLVAISLASTGLLPNFVITAQEPSPQELSEEAGRLGTEAERIRGHAYKQVRAGGDRKLILEVERVAAIKFRRALELWRAAGDDERVVAVAEELSRIYSILNDYEGAVGSLQRELEFWRERGNVARQVNTLWLIAIRQRQMQRDKEATKTLEEVVEISRAANLIYVAYNALESLARLYEKAGRGVDAEKLKTEAQELLGQMHSMSLSSISTQKQREPIKLPSQWLNLPSAPLVAEYINVDGIQQAVLVNRSIKGIEMVAFGCIIEQDGKVRVVDELGTVAQNHGGVGPGRYYEPFEFMNGPLNPWTDKKKRCEEKAKMVVIKAIYDDRTEWAAEGLDWIIH